MKYATAVFWVVKVIVIVIVYRSRLHLIFNCWYNLHLKSILCEKFLESKSSETKVFFAYFSQK